MFKRDFIAEILVEQCLLSRSTEHLP